jgi:hypothetical protein
MKSHNNILLWTVRPMIMMWILSNVIYVSEKKRQQFDSFFITYISERFHCLFADAKRYITEELEGGFKEEYTVLAVTNSFLIEQYVFFF